MSYYSESDTLGFMPYTCPDVDYATENSQGDSVYYIKDACSALENSFNDRLELLKEKLVTIIPETEIDGILEDFEDDFLNDINEKMDGLEDEVFNCFDTVNSEIKNNVTYEWRRQSVAMMNYAHEDNSAYENELDELKSDIESLLKENETYNYLVQWNRDMGISNPEFVGKCNLDISHQSDFFSLLGELI